MYLPFNVRPRNQRCTFPTFWRWKSQVPAVSFFGGGKPSKSWVFPNIGVPKSSILIVCSLIAILGFFPPIFGNTQLETFSLGNLSVLPKKKNKFVPSHQELRFKKIYSSKNNIYCAFLLQEGVSSSHKLLWFHGNPSYPPQSYPPQK